MALAVVAGVGTAWAYARTRPVPALLTVLSPAPLLFLFVFLVISPTSELVLPSGDVEASKASLPQSTPVVMIVFDEFSGYSLMGRDGRIDVSRFPSFARLARDGTWYRNASSVADFTNHAVPALLTGERPEHGAAPIAADHPESLFTFLGGKYRFDVTEPVTDVCPEQLCPAEAASRPPAKDRLHDLYSDLRLVSAHLLLPDDLADGLPAVDRSFADFRKSDQEANGDAQLSAQEAARAFAAIDAVIGRVTEFNAFTSRLGKGGGGRRLHFLHVQLPHNPYHFLPNGQRYPDPLAELPGLEKKGAPAGKWSKDRWLAREAFARYLLQLQYADRLLGRRWRRCEGRGSTTARWSW